MKWTFLQFRLWQFMLLIGLMGVLLGRGVPYFQQTFYKSRIRHVADKLVRAQKELERAAQENDLDLARSVFASGFTFEQLTSGRRPLLHEGVARGQIEMVELLLKNGAAVHRAGGDYRGPPLFTAIGSKQSAETRIEMIRLLVRHGADPRQTDHQFGKESTMDVAVRVGDAQVADLLRELGVPYGPREMAAFNRLAELRQAVADAPELVHQRFVPVWGAWEGHGPTLLGIALGQGHREMAQWLIDSGAPVDTIEYMGETLLHAAARGGDPEMMRLLIANGLDVNVCRYDGEMPLNPAVGNGDAEIVNQLLEAGAKVEDSMLFAAVSKQNREIAVQLLAAGANPFATDSLGRTVLDVARTSGDNVLVKLIEAAQLTGQRKCP